MRTGLVNAAVALVCVGLAGCGTPGAPRPPSLHLPETVRDLAATRQGSTVSLTWTEPQRTTDGETIRALGPTLVCMGVNDFPMTHCNVVADLSQGKYASCAPKAGQAASCAVTMANEVQQQYPLGQATYAVEVLNANGRSAGLSNQVRVPTAPTLPPPTDLSARLQSEEVVLIWTVPVPEKGVPQLSHYYRVLRSERGRPATEIGRIRGLLDLQALFLDRSFAWEKDYVYQVQPITIAHLPGGGVDVPGEPSAPVTVTTKDIFPPAAPQGVQAVASGVGQQPFVDLTWAPNTEGDLAGYNVYRYEEGQPAVKINAELVKGPSYRDAKVEPGKAYFYSVSAIDSRNNESPKSAETSEKVR